jgi:hypothetical protein
VLHPPRAVSDTARLKRELIEAGFIALDLLTPLRSASAAVKLGYTALWTGVTLVAVLRGLGRMRAIRLQGPERPR